MARRKIIAGNWKMNGLTSFVDTLAQPLAEFMVEEKCFDMLVCPPFPILDRVVQLAEKSNILVGAQNCHAETSGAHTGDTSAEMIKNIAATHVIVGHSERRADCGETDAIVKAKAEATIANDLVAVVCCGEVKEQRESGQAIDVVSTQIKGSLPEGATAVNTIVAYEPVWAIGTGLVASIQDVEDMHKAIRETLSTVMTDYEDVRVLYGGSVKPANAKEILATENVDGVLVGGASLDAESFIEIAKSVSC